MSFWDSYSWCPERCLTQRHSGIFRFASLAGLQGALGRPLNCNYGHPELLALIERSRSSALS